jgi:hypothetical protein
LTELVTDYSPVHTTDAVYRYIWVITFVQSGPDVSIPPPGLYYIDAATGENVTPLLF